MSKLRTLWLPLVWMTLFFASAVFLALLASQITIPSIVMAPLTNFVQPGVTAWWLILGGLFQSVPTTPSGIAFASFMNASLWSLAIWFVVFIFRKARRKPATSHS